MKYLYTYCEDFKERIEVRHGKKKISMKTMVKEAQGRKYVEIAEILDESFGLHTHCIEIIDLEEKI